MCNTTITVYVLYLASMIFEGLYIFFCLVWIWALFLSNVPIYLGEKKDVHAFDLVEETKEVKRLHCQTQYAYSITNFHWSQYQS